MKPTAAAPVRKSIVVNAAADRAFTLFIDRFDAISRANTTCSRYRWRSPEGAARTRVELEHRYLDAVTGEVQEVPQ
ncbi:hypothetical protein [Mycobacterium sp. DBP42]|uniref:hypothetical protein n=1 Tax=Mycobacterium sp. DBP42 TaxID=2545267 RepID=UPI001BB26F2F|nr:hypothetical protein [Mycobacterium sp. DBP42]